MKQLTWQIDLKSMMIGILLATVAALLINAYPSRAAGGGGAVAADAEGVYIMHENGQVRYIHKNRCYVEQGCNFHTK